MHQQRIHLTDNINDVFYKLSEGNAGALTVPMDLWKRGVAIDHRGGLLDVAKVCTQLKERLPNFQLEPSHDATSGTVGSTSGTVALPPTGPQEPGDPLG